MPTTYSDQIWELMQKSESIYNDAGSLRDMASPQEKEFWNKVRNVYREGFKVLAQLRDSLPQDRRDRIIGDKDNH